MTVPVFDPQVSVVLKKNVGRKTIAGNTPASQRFVGQKSEVDLTPYLGDTGEVVTEKSVRTPAGMFRVVLADRFNPDQLETLYGLIEPMDVVEIRMARDISKYAGSGTQKNMPIVMRGFVTDVSRDEVMTERGPRRTVAIQGQDYGKVLQIMQIAYLPNEVTGQRLLTYFKFFQNYDSSADTNKTASQFIEDVNSNVIMKFLADMKNAAAGTSPVLDIKVDATVAHGIVSPIGTVQSFQGNVYQMMQFYGDVGPWNELFIEDREDGVYLVYRPTPFKDPTGSIIQDGAAAPASITVTDSELVASRVSRSDSGVYNYYWVNPVNYNLNTPGYLQVQAAHNDVSQFYIADYPNSTTDLYGFRRLEVETQQGPRFDGKDEQKYLADGQTTIGFTATRRQVLRDNNKDNVVFETGTLQIRGNEAVKAGMTVVLERGNGPSRSEYYAVSVTQSFKPFGSFMTTVSFERGTGFISRVQQGGGQGGPYFSEMNADGVYAG